MNRYQYGHAAAWTSAFDASGVPMTVTYNGTTYFYATNLQGDVVAILDSNGAAVVEYTYNAWGNLYSISGSLAVSLGLYNPLHYRGYVYDIETGLYYLQSRYYDPEMGRFINADAFASTGQGLLGNNMFAYCNNNSVNRYDPSGYAAGWSNLVVIKDGSSGFTPGSAAYILGVLAKKQAQTQFVNGCSRAVDVVYSGSSHIVNSMLKNVRVSGGAGFGLYVEGDVLDLGVGLGTYYDFIAFEWQNGKTSTYKYGYAGITSNIGLVDFGAAASVQHGGGGKPISERWILYNKQQDTIPIGDLGAALYTPLFGGRIELSLDWVGLYRDLGIMR